MSKWGGLRGLCHTVLSMKLVEDGIQYFAVAIAQRVLAGANLLVLPAFHEWDVHHVLLRDVDDALVRPQL